MEDLVIDNFSEINIELADFIKGDQNDKSDNAMAGSAAECATDAISDNDNYVDNNDTKTEERESETEEQFEEIKF